MEHSLRVKEYIAQTNWPQDVIGKTNKGGSDVTYSTTLITPGK